MPRWSDFLHCSKQSTEGGSSVYYAVEQRWGKWGEDRGGAQIVVYSWLLFPVLPDPRQADSCSQQVDALCFGLPSVSCLSMCTWESLV